MLYGHGIRATPVDREGVQSREEKCRPDTPTLAKDLTGSGMLATRGMRENLRARAAYRRPRFCSATRIRCRVWRWETEGMHDRYRQLPSPGGWGSGLCDCAIIRAPYRGHFRALVPVPRRRGRLREDHPRAAGQPSVLVSQARVSSPRRPAPANASRCDAFRWSWIIALSVVVMDSPSGTAGVHRRSLTPAALRNAVHSPMPALLFRCDRLTARHT